MVKQFETVKSNAVNIFIWFAFILDFNFFKLARGPLAVKHQLKRLWGALSVNTQRD